MPICVRLCGHSFFNRLYDHIQENPSTFDTNFGFFPDSMDCRWKVFGGAKLENFSVDLVLKRNPHIVVFEIGSNELTETGLDVLTWAGQYNDLITQLLCHDTKPASLVIIMPIFFRTRAGVTGLPFLDGVQLYNERVKKANMYLKNFAESNPKVLFWEHRRERLITTNTKLLGDGIHLMPKYFKPYYLSVRQAISIGEDVVRGKRSVKVS